MPEGRAVRPHNSKQMQRICLESLSFYDRLKVRASSPCGEDALLKWQYGALPAAAALLCLEGSTLGAVAALGLRITAAYFDGVQGAVVLHTGMIGAGIHAALNAVIDLFHDTYLLCRWQG